MFVFYMVSLLKNYCWWVTTGILLDNFRKPCRIDHVTTLEIELHPVSVVGFCSVKARKMLTDLISI